VPGTKIAFAGIKDEQKIKDLIAYLHTYDKAPVNASIKRREPKSCVLAHQSAASEIAGNRRRSC
jgi:hypothetical protein